MEERGSLLKVFGVDWLNIQSRTEGYCSAYIRQQVYVVTSKTKTHIYHAVVKSTITYAAETWCLKAKTTAKLNSTEMDLW